MSLALNI